MLSSSLKAQGESERGSLYKLFKIDPLFHEWDDVVYLCAVIAVDDADNMIDTWYKYGETLRPCHAEALGGLHVYGRFGVCQNQFRYFHSSHASYKKIKAGKGLTLAEYRQGYRCRCIPIHIFPRSGVRGERQIEIDQRVEDAVKDSLDVGFWVDCCKSKGVCKEPHTNHKGPVRSPNDNHHFKGRVRRFRLGRGQGRKAT